MTAGFNGSCREFHHNAGTSERTIKRSNMKVVSTEVLQCEVEGAGHDKEPVLKLTYTHYGKEGTVLIRNWDDRWMPNVLKTLRKELSTLLKEKQNVA